MSPEEQAAEAAEAANQQTPEEIAEAEKIAAEAANQKPIYSAEELESLHPTAIDLERVDPAARPIVEKTIKEYKSLQGDYTKKTQELSDLKKAAVPEEETYFGDQNKNGVFKDYLKNPLKVLGDINAEISRLETIIPDDGSEEYRKARREIAQWQAIKDEFREKRSEVNYRSQKEEVAEAKLVAELGADAPALIEYAKGLGFSERDFKSKPELRSAIRKAYEIANADKTAQAKERKSAPHKAAPTSGGGGSGSSAGGDDDIFDPKISTEERIARFRKNRAA
jgi:hypothetical protein